MSAPHDDGLRPSHRIPAVRLGGRWIPVGPMVRIDTGGGMVTQEGLIMLADEPRPPEAQDAPAKGAP